MLHASLAGDLFGFQKIALTSFLMKLLIVVWTCNSTLRFASICNHGDWTGISTSPILACVDILTLAVHIPLGALWPFLL